MAMANMKLYQLLRLLNFISKIRILVKDFIKKKVNFNTPK